MAALSLPLEGKVAFAKQMTDEVSPLKAAFQTERIFDGRFASYISNEVKGIITV